ncbi:MAG: SRPBCC family protein [Candidatus Dormibacteria bacterium]
MELETSFKVAAPPARVFSYVTDVRQVVTCVPGAELTEIVDAKTYRGKMSVSVGPMKVAYSGTAQIRDQDDANHAVTVEGIGKETGGSGSASASARLSVVADGEGSVVKVVTDYTIRGRVAQFGRGIIEDVFRSVIEDMGRRIKAAVESEPPAEGAVGGGAATAVLTQTEPLNAFGLVFRVLWARIVRLFRRAPRTD